MGTTATANILHFSSVPWEHGRHFEEAFNIADRERWLGLPFTAVDGLSEEGQVCVKQGILAATVAAPTTTPIAISLLVQGIEKEHKLRFVP